MSRIHLFPLLLSCVLLAASCTASGGRSSAAASSQVSGTSSERPLEMPAPIKDRPERIIRHTGYALSYNREKLQPNYVAWELTKEEANGTLPRDDDFMADPAVPAPQRVEPTDYRASGYDRGHMVPAADMKWSEKAMRESFYMSNICPQKHGLNSGPWSKLESACRRWATREGEVFVVCGPVFHPDTKPRTIGSRLKIAVPDGFFKVVLCMKKGREKAIGFYYANRDGKQPMPEAACSVDDIERLTGIDFFVNLPDDVEERLEKNYQFNKWQ